MHSESTKKTSTVLPEVGPNINWPVNVKVDTPSCTVCHRIQSLVVQLYCCLEQSLYHRTLYVFACSNPTCWNNQQSWTVYRCQSLDSSTQDSVMSNAKADQMANVDNYLGKRGDGADDWGGDADDWGGDADDWSGDADDWGGDADDLRSQDPNVNKISNEWGTVTDDWSSGTDVNDASCNIPNNADNDTNHSDKESNFKVNSSGADKLDMEHLCIDDVTDDVMDDVTTDNGDGITDTNSHVLSEDMPSLSDQEKTNFLNTCQASTVHDSVYEQVLESYYINVFEEPSSQLQDNYHVAKLLKNYQKQEGCNVKDLMEGFSGEGGGKSENYEKTSLLHRDFMFHKFMKRLSVCPEQCIRYQWGGSALFNSSIQHKLPSTCCHCGGEVVFELQLTPALINHLKFPGHKDSAIEFGTVLVYTCKQSCWEDVATFKVEQVLVQPDPDHHLFKKQST